ncbi:hypothetical protein AMK16_11320 [Streptomyces sp. CB00455]|uniref:hypothetical protein n=1 Tax=Streptomyces sp. CB00455 TaxID=1703927 RepID=UPI00093939AD|nr:hypothetical protein [Streptomyces sp. CB00455]OKK20973.1 hypothetical protein AMK16_11320 [Streptomyces sp. CB00455]
MRSALVRRSVLTASAVSLTLLATACGSDKADTTADAKPSAAAPATSAPAPAAKAKTAAELTPLLVTQADLPDHKVEDDAAAAAAAKGKPAETDKPECKPLVQFQSFQSVGAPAGTARVAATSKPQPAAEGATMEEKLDAAMKGLSVTRTSVALNSYDGKGAEEALAALKGAVTACAGGYTVAAEGDSTKIEKVVPGTPAAAGDEALAFAVVIDLKDGDKATWQLAAVRKGNTLATFTSMNLTGDAEQPKAIVDAQAKKLG